MFLIISRKIILIFHHQLQWSPLRSLKVSFAELQAIVAANDKQRFQLISAPDSTSASTEDPATSHNPSHHLIRSTQGHSIAIASEALLAPILPADPDFPEEVVHGTYTAALKKIMESNGLSRMGRRHVHFATGLPSASGAKSNSSQAASPVVSRLTQSGPGEAEIGESVPGVGDKSEEAADSQKVISGMRRSANILIWVDVRKSIEDAGLKWWRSANGVLLTEGNDQGMVDLKFVTRIVDRQGNLLWSGEPKVAGNSSEKPL